MRFAVLGSGSKGNCLVIDGGGVVVLIDAGFSPREIRARLRHLELDLADVDALLITHGHGDHVKGARQLAGSLTLPTWATEETRRFSSTFTALKHHRRVDAGVRFRVGGLTIHPVKTVHDEPGSVAYVVDDGDHALGICTDLGTPSAEVGAALHGVDSLLLEFNHDRQMLANGPYPAHLKRRVGSRFGHLKNEDGAVLLEMARSTALSRVLCAHLSEVNNTPEKALAAARPLVDGADVDLACAPQHAPTSWLRVRRRPEGTPHVRVRPAIVDDVVETATASAMHATTHATHATHATTSATSATHATTSATSATHATTSATHATTSATHATTHATTSAMHAAASATSAAAPTGAVPLALQRQLALFSSTPTARAPEKPR